MIKAADELEKIREYVKSLRFDAEGLAKQTDKVKANYRQFHALLIWETFVERSNASDDTKERAREVASDVATAYFLTILGIYKSARLSSRSGIENFCRLCLLLQSQAADHENVYSLLDDFRNLFAEGPMRNLADALRSEYATLCKTVHSAAVDYMSLRVPFEKIVEFSEKEFGENIDRIQSVLKPANAILYALLGRDIDSLGPNLADFLKDATPREIKRLAAFGLNS